MTKITFQKWLKVIEKIEKKNKEMLRKKEITPNVYSLLNKINLDKYCWVIKEYQKTT